MAHMSLYPISCIYNYVIQLCLYLISHPILLNTSFSSLDWIGLRETPQIFHGTHGKHVDFHPIPVIHSSKIHPELTVLTSLGD